MIIIIIIILIIIIIIIIIMVQWIFYKPIVKLTPEISYYNKQKLKLIGAINEHNNKLS